MKNKEIDSVKKEETKKTEKNEIRERINLGVEELEKTYEEKIAAHKKATKRKF